MTNTQSPAPGVAAEARKPIKLEDADRVELLDLVGDATIDANVPPQFALVHLTLLCDFAEALLKRAAAKAALQASAAAVPLAFHDPLGRIGAEAFVFASDYPKGTSTHTVPLYTAPPLPAQVQEADPQIAEKLTALQIGKCTCLTKTPELQFHDKRCTYRLAAELESLLASRTPAPGMAGGVVMFPHPVEILRAMSEQGKARTSAENIADVLCALAKAGIAAPHPSPAPQAGAAETEWLKFDIENPPAEGLYWVRSEAPEVDVDVDDYGQTVGRYTGDSEYSTALVVFHGVTDSRPDFEVLDKWNSGDLSSEGWVTHYLPVNKPAFPASGRDAS